MAAQHLGRSIRAAELLGSASSIWDGLGASDASRSVWSFSQAQATTNAVRLALGEREFEGAYAAGQRMSAQQALEMVHQS